MSLYLEGMLTIYTLLIPKNQWRHFSEIPCGIFLRDAKNHPLVETEASPLKFSNSNDFILTYSFQRLPSTLFSSKGFHRIWIWFKCLWPLGMQFAAFSLKIQKHPWGLTEGNLHQSPHIFFGPSPLFMSKWPPTDNFFYFKIRGANSHGEGSCSLWFRDGLSGMIPPYIE